MDKDFLLRFFDICLKYIIRVKENKSVFYEFKVFKYGEEMRNVLEKVIRKLNFKFSVFLEDYIVGMYIVCMFEVVVYDKENIWCELFEEEDLLVLDYLFDLKYYWKWGYGYFIIYKIGCFLLERIVIFLKNVIELLLEDRMYGVFMFVYGEIL